jgi:hypothetical protein
MYMSCHKHRYVRRFGRNDIATFDGSGVCSRLRTSALTRPSRGTLGSEQRAREGIKNSREKVGGKSGENVLSIYPGLARMGRFPYPLSRPMLVRPSDVFGYDRARTTLAVVR